MATTATSTGRTHDLLPSVLYTSPTFAPLLRFLEDIDKRLDLSHHSHSCPHRERHAFSPRFDLLELPTQFELYGDLPGVKKKDVFVELKEQGKVLVVKGKRGDCSVKGEGEERAEGNYIVAERGMGGFEKRFRLSGEVRSEGIWATLEEGILKVVVPRVAGVEEERGHRIEIL